MSVILYLPEKDCGIRDGISFDGQRFTKGQDQDAWCTHSTEFHARNLSDLMPVFGISPPCVIPQSMRDAYGYLTESNVPWVQAVGKERFLDRLKKIHTEVSKWLEDTHVNKYLKTLLIEREVLDQIRPTKIDTREFEARKSSPSVESFSPNSSGFARNVMYSHATTTGRLKVVEGPKILTLSKQDRRVISSRFSGGRILQVDFVSLEPRVALYTVGQNPGKDDVYEWIAKSVDPSLSRTKVKVPTLSILYGQSARNDDPVSSSLREKIGSIFKTAELRDASMKDGRFQNGFGRPLEEPEDRLRISHYVQSTAVDVAILGFRSILNDLHGHVGKGIVPIFMLHDALILDVSPDLYRLLKTRVEAGVDVDPLGHFPLTLGPIWDE
jgi:hypothetical protein